MARSRAERPSRLLMAAACLALPAGRITLLGGPWGVEAVRHNADLDAIETCVFPGFERQPKENGLAPYRLLVATARKLRAADYDTAAILRFDHWWGAWLAAAAGIPPSTPFSEAGSSAAF